jgi:hypothetical protein
MAVPITGAKLKDVKTELEKDADLTITSLQGAVDNAIDNGYDATYFTTPSTSLKEFRNYDYNETVASCITENPDTRYQGTDPNFIITFTVCVPTGFALGVDGIYVYKDGVLNGTWYNTTTALTVTIPEQSSVDITVAILWNPEGETGDVYGTMTIVTGDYQRVPNPPTALQSTLISNDGFTLGWTAPASGPTPTGYDIYDDGVFQVDAGLVTSYAITGEGANSTSIWTIKAYNASGDSVASAGKSVTTGPTVTAFSIRVTGSVDAITACAVPSNFTRYKTGDADDSFDGDVWYEESTAITVMDGNNEYWASVSNSGGGGNKSFVLNISGNQGSTADC